MTLLDHLAVDHKLDNDTTQKRLGELEADTLEYLHERLHGEERKAK